MQLKSVVCYPKFWWYAAAASSGAEKSPGNVHTSTNAAFMPTTRNGITETKHTLFTLTVWEDRASTMSYVRSKEHRAAAKLSRELGSYMKSHHYESETIPTWEEAKLLWQEQGREYNMDRKSATAGPSVEASSSDEAIETSAVE